jgi:hypothetical protein
MLDSDSPEKPSEVLSETQEVGILPSLTAFTAQDYQAGSLRLSYINTIFRSHNLELPPRLIFPCDRSENSDLVGRFFRESTYTPDTKLAQLVQVIASEASLMARFSFTKGGPMHRLPRLIQEIKDTALPGVRKVKHEIAQEVFGDESIDYSTKLTQAFFAHRFSETFSMPGKNKDARIKERDQILNELLSKISTIFPSAGN